MPVHAIACAHEGMTCLPALHTVYRDCTIVQKIPPWHTKAQLNYHWEKRPSNGDLPSHFDCHLGTRPLQLPCITHLWRALPEGTQDIVRRSDPEIAAAFHLSCADCQEVQPYKASSISWTLTDQDHSIVSMLRDTSIQRPIAAPENLKRLRSIMPGEHYSCHCKASTIRFLLRHALLPKSKQDLQPKVVGNPH